MRMTRMDTQPDRYFL